MNVVVSVWISCLKFEDRGSLRSIQLDNCLHWKRSVDKVGILVIDIPDSDDDSLSLRIIKVWSSDEDPKVNGLVFSKLFVIKSFFDTNCSIGINDNPSVG